MILLEHPAESIAAKVRKLDSLPSINRFDFEAEIGVAIIGIGTFDRYFIVAIQAVASEPRLRASLNCTEDRDGRMRRITAKLERTNLSLDEGGEFKREIFEEQVKDFVEALIDDCIRITREKG